MKARTNSFVFTKAALDALEPPLAGQRLTVHDITQPGLQLRVTSSGVKTFCVFKRVAGGQPERVTIGRYPELTIAQARAAARGIINQLASGTSLNTGKRQAKAAKADTPTLREAIEEYCAKARRVSDDKPLKPRTQDDYKAMVKNSVTKRTGYVTKAGELLPLADKLLTDITADQIRGVYDTVHAHSARRANYAMVVLRAIFNYFEVPIPENLFSKTTARRKRIHLAPAGVAGECIHMDDVGKWWRLLKEMEESDAVNYLKFLIITGCRPSEPLQITIENIDFTRRWVTLVDTKNRSNHVLMLSDQAWEIVQKQAAGKATGDQLFKTYDAWKTVAKVKEITGVHFHCKMLRATFATIADSLVSGSTVKRLMNHKQKNDITSTHYIQKNEQQLREGWQAVADWLDEQAALAKAGVITMESA
ncbi:tyrosine-type recombinase/integrase [Pseudogulbenkiania subflava]|uniref:Integrase n=1 Tax=Pseudogulbenkiania subflava DSM 22618 TaxID=1123014 RepID=A0A1Y6C990_9NEIS|nr:integrase family protein [Pseudogulbenkiania subflava]SMF43347.1 Integrase [Pseudogulbenkiania subflava DSM 22618]